MKLITNSLCIVLFLFIQIKLNSQVPCGFDAEHFSRLQTDENYKDQMNDLESRIKAILLQEKTNSRSKPPIYDIPVAVHVIHFGEPIGTGSNISDAQITGAIQTLNNEFNNTNGTGVDMQIHFCLAVRDPNGNPTTGINRVNGTVIPNYSSGGINNYYYPNCANENAVKDLSKWPSKSYLNIWIVGNICGGSISGIATGQTGSLYDGITILYSQVSASKVTLAHEMGHMFNLFHTFHGDGTNVTQGGPHYCPADSSCADNGDRVCDTPPHKQGDYGVTNPCSSDGIWDNSRYNFMSYSFLYSGNFNTNTCRFTQGQKDRARAILLAIPYHPYVFANGCNPVSPNDAAIQNIKYPLPSIYSSSCTSQQILIPIVKIKNYGSNPLTSVNINYKLNNEALHSFQWNGFLENDASEEVSLPGISIADASNNLLVYTSSPNNMADGYPVNDDQIIAFNFNTIQTLDLETQVTNATCFGEQDGTATVSAKSKVEIIEDWESTSDWTVVNGSEMNHWAIGSATANGGNKSIYISNDNQNNTYNNLVTSVVHFYKDFYFPPGATNIKIKFDWKGNGEFSNVPGGVDRFRVYLIPTDEIVQALFQITSSPYLGSYHSQNSYKTDSITNLDAIAGSAKRLVFSWRNNYAYGNQAPASIDNIIVSYELPNTYSYEWNTNPIQYSTTAIQLLPNTYEVVVTDETGCTQNASITIQQQNQIQTNIIADGPTHFCEGGTVNLSATEADSYMWSTGENTQTIIVTHSGNYTVTITNSNGCIGVSSPISIQVNPFPIAVITPASATTFCQGGSVTLEANAASSYLWNTGETSQEISAISSGDYRVTITDEKGCIGISNPIPVLVNAPPQAIITPASATTFCKGGSVTLAANVASSYLWNAGETSKEISVINSGEYIVTITDQNGCTASSAKIIVTVNKVADIPQNILGQTNGVCAQTVKNYSTPVVNNVIYFWTAPQGSTILQGQYTNNVMVSFGSNFKSGTLSLVLYNNCGLSPSRKVVINSVPVIPSNISGPSFPSCNANNIYKINKVADAQSYVWTSNIVGAIIIPNPSPGDTAVNIQFPPFASGTVSVSANNACGSSSVKTTTVSATIATASKIYGNISPCVGTLQYYYIAKLSGATSYQWSVPPGSIIKSGFSSNIIQVLIGNNGGEVSVSGVNDCSIGVAKILPIASPCVSIINTNATHGSLSLFPNPTSNMISISFIETETGSGQIQLTDLKGRLLQSHLLNYFKGENKLDLDLSDYNDGVYLIQYTGKYFTKSIKVVKD